MRNFVVLAFVSSTLSAVVGCAPQNPDIGRACDVDDPCPADMYCLPDYEGEPVCMESCGVDDVTCGDGSLCLGTTSGGAACWIGGPVPVGGECSTHGDCAHGGICIRIVGEERATCRAACAPTLVNECLSNEVCQETLEGDYGFCVSTL